MNASEQNLSDPTLAVVDSAVVPAETDVKRWIDPESATVGSQEVWMQRLCEGFNASPFCAHIGLSFSVVEGHVQGELRMQPHLIGNTHFRILHGGVAATVLDTIGGIEAMSAMFHRWTGDPETRQKALLRMATVDMRVDYLSPGKGGHFVAKATVIRMGRKGCTTRMHLFNDQGKEIATGIASYAY